MLFPVEDYKEFAKKYDLRIKEGFCPKCKKPLITNIPFFIKGYVGLKSADDGCGETYTRKTMTAYSKDEKSFWADFAKSIF